MSAKDPSVVSSESSDANGGPAGAVPGARGEPGARSARSTEKACFILNPRAGGGRAARRVDELKRELDKVFSDWQVRTTEGPRHASHLARAAAEEGFGLIAAVGGDGTCHEVVNGLRPEGGPGRSDVVFTVIPLGTGSDLQKSLEVPSALDEALRAAAWGPTLASDYGKVRYLADDGSVRNEAWINVAGFGANGEVVRAANKSSKRFGGTVTFFGASLKTTFSYTPPQMRLRWAGMEEGSVGEWSGPLLSCFVGNGAFCGGGMKIGQPGSLQDGALDITVLPPDPVLTQIIRSRRLYDGSLDRWPGVRQTRVRWLEAEPVESRECPIDLDGESPGILPARFELVPGGLAIRGAWRRPSALR